jgi:hypothetical protein
VFIEADSARFAELKKNYAGRFDIICLNKQVRAGKDDLRSRAIPLDELIETAFPQRRIDFLSIDIDGLDYLVFEELRTRPTVVCVEGGFSWHPCFRERVPDEVAKHDLQQPLSVLTDIGRSNGYEIVCFNQDAYFVLRDLANRYFAETARDAFTLWSDAWFNETSSFRTGLARMRASNSLIRNTEGFRFAALPWSNLWSEN